MAASEAEEDSSMRLSELLEAGWRLLEEVEASTEPSSGSATVQRKVQRGIRLLERALRAVAELQLFSRGEELEEVASADLRFMLAPALLAALVLKQGCSGAEQRLERLERARAAFLRFLTVCRDYGVGRFELPREPRQAEEGESSSGSSLGLGAPSEQAALMAMAANRQAKIERYKQKKEVENRLASLKTFVDSGQAEEEQIREFYLLQIKKWIGTSLDEIESIDQEIAILSRRDALKKGPSHRPFPPARPPVKPFILTRDAAQAKVFGAGYPSLATMTVDDWYEQHQKREVLPDQGIPRRPAATEEQQKEEGEEKAEAEEDNEEATWKAREWDDWKETHPRGYGNRKNMG